MRSIAEAVVIGGGIIGASTLYHLAVRGLHDTVLLERGALGSGTTAYTAGWVRLQRGTELGIQMSQMAFAEFRRFQHEEGIGLETRGSISIGMEDAAGVQRQQADFQRSHGVPTTVLTAAEIKALAPIVNLQGVGVGRYCPEDGLVDAHALLQAYVRKARALGAEVAEDARATGVVVDAGKVVGVETTGGFISTPAVVNAAGIYSGQVGSWVGLDMPLRNELGHMVFTEPIASLPDRMPLLEILDREAIYVGSRGNRAEYAVGTFDVTDAFEHKPDMEHFVERYGNLLLHRVPDVAVAGIVDCIAGIRTSAPDGWPIVGPVRDLKGFFNNCGWGGNGIVFAPVAGRLVAESIMGVGDGPLTTAPFLLQRFQADSGVGEARFR